MTQPIGNRPIEILADHATDAHARIQRDTDIDPIVGVSQHMRTQGFPADVMTIDCLKTNKRIIIILHDDMPEVARYQFAFRDQQDAQLFQRIPFKELTSDKLYEWIKQYFQTDSSGTTH